jgi:tetratricopeptide (TPR) repeat protein
LARCATWPAGSRRRASCSRAPRRIGIPREEASALLELAELAEAEGDLAEAERLLDEAGACRSANEAGARTSELLARARLASARGQPAEAARLFGEAAETAREVAEIGSETMALAARAAASGDGVDEASARLREREEKMPVRLRLEAHRFLARVTGDPEHVAAVGRLAAHLRAHLGEPGPDIGKVALFRPAD